MLIDKRIEFLIEINDFEFNMKILIFWFDFKLWRCVKWFQKILYQQINLIQKFFKKHKFRCIFAQMKRLVSLG